MTIDLSDLVSDLEEDMLPDGRTPSPFTPEHAEAAAKVLGFQSAEQRAAVDPPRKRKRRTKAEMEAARAAETAQKVLSDTSSTPTEMYDAVHQQQVTAGAAYDGPTREEKLAELDARNDALNEKDEPTPFDGFPSPPLDAPPVADSRNLAWDAAPADATDSQVLIDEMHFLREDIRENTAEIRKLALAIERMVEARALEGKAA